MNLDRYVYFTNNDFHDYEFYSEGPNGRIQKVVRFACIQQGNPGVYNLGFGDLNSEGVVDDTSVSNNADRDKVLATVASTIIDFCNRHGDHYIYASGSTPSRTRLYQMSISRLWDDIQVDFEVYGLKDNEWHEFSKNTNYTAFLVKRR
ncbi:DUF6934 family protein [Parapedobacter sp. DT-150]|uniref:DUF6934 family protein n=1 Tax=Parapedobacter sp. DT-150 TaxID=3396162 RepID=UPI003F1AD01D